MNPRNVVKAYRAALVGGAVGAITVFIGGMVASYVTAAAGLALAIVAMVTGLHMQTRLLIRTAERQRQRTERLLDDQLHQLSAAIDKQADSARDLARDIEVRITSKGPSESELSELKTRIAGIARSVASMEAILISELDSATSRTIGSLTARFEATSTSAQAREDALISSLDRTTARLLAGQRQILDRQARSDRRHHQFLAAQLRGVRGLLVDASKVLSEEFAELSKTSTEQRQASQRSQDSISRIADSMSQSCAELSKLASILDEVHRVTVHTQATTSETLDGQQDTIRETQRHLKQISEALSVSSSDLASFLSTVAENRDVMKDTLIAMKALVSNSDITPLGTPQASSDGLGTAANPILDRLEESAARLDQVHDSITEGFRATRVGLEQVPQTVEEYRHLHETLVPHKLTLPGIGGWAMTATAISAVAARVLDAQEPPTVVELGSGISTVWLSLAMRKREGGRLLSLDHLEEFLEQTRTLVAQNGALEFTELIHAPLTSVEISNSRYDWYDLSNFDANASIDILIVDGPPGDGGPHARYPALPLLAGQLAPGAAILVDDTIRFEERRIIEQWQSEFPEISVEQQLDKATLLRWEAN